MPTVELVYDADCPNVGEARAQLLRSFAESGIEARWREWRADDPEAPSHVHGFGSPTVLVEGRDVAGAVPAEGTRCCRIYDHGGGAALGVPPVEDIVAGLKLSGGPPSRGTGRRSGWRSSMAVVPAVGVALLPKVACPACWPAYTGFLSTLGLGFLLNTTVLSPLTGVFLAIALGALAFHARSRRGYGPFTVGLVAAAIVWIGKFTFESDAAMYAGLGVLVAASLWNSWPRKQTITACPACVPKDHARPQPEPTRREAMTTKRTIEVFSAGCPACQETIDLVNRVACPSCEVSVLDMRDASVTGRAKDLGIRSVPAVVIDGKLADCCAGRGPAEATLRAAGLWQA